MDVVILVLLLSAYHCCPILMDIILKSRKNIRKCAYKFHIIFNYLKWIFQIFMFNFYIVRARYLRTIIIFKAKPFNIQGLSEHLQQIVRCFPVYSLATTETLSLFLKNRIKGRKRSSRFLCIFTVAFLVFLAGLGRIPDILLLYNAYILENCVLSYQKRLKIKNKQLLMGTFKKCFFFVFTDSIQMQCSKNSNTYQF